MFFCIFGTGRCGSTLLQKMLNSHPDFFVYQETHWIPEMYKRFGNSKVNREKLIHIAKKTHHVNGKPTFPFKENHFHGLKPYITLQDFCNHIGNVIAQENNKKYWADKTPDYGYFIHNLQQLWPKCKFIHIVRYGPHVIESMSKHPGYQALAHFNQLHWCEISYDFQGGYSISNDIKLNDFVHMWYSRLITTKILSQQIPSQNYYELKYEDLVKQPHQYLAQLLQFLEVNAEFSWINYAASLVNQKEGTKNQRDEIVRLLSKKEETLLGMFGYKL